MGVPGYLQIRYLTNPRWPLRHRSCVTTWKKAGCMRPQVQSLSFDQPITRPGGCLRNRDRMPPRIENAPGAARRLQRIRRI